MDVCIGRMLTVYTLAMRILLTEGSGLTSRQVAGLLRAKGHDVGVLSCDPRGLTRFTRSVTSWYPIVAFGSAPLEWLDTALDIYQAEGYDLLFPTQEQVAVLAARPKQLADAGVITGVPAFESILAVQDKVAARATLSRFDLPQPESEVLTSSDELAAWNRFPVYIKTPIGTATNGVHRLDKPAELHHLSARLDADVFGDGGVLAQMPASGPLIMVQAVFCQGRLLAFHANLRIRQGASGSASHKRSIREPQTRRMVQELGEALCWHGALSFDVILTDDGPSIIDINPRLVEPMNAHHSGVDLVGAMIDVAQNDHPVERSDGQPDINTHQLLLAILGAAQNNRGRRGVATEIVSAVAGRNHYSDSAEELTPFRMAGRRRDWLAPIPLAASALAALVAPKSWRHLAANSVSNYALSPPAWRDIQRHTQPMLR